MAKHKVEGKLVQQTRTCYQYISLSLAAQLLALFFLISPYTRKVLYELKKCSKLGIEFVIFHASFCVFRRSDHLLYSHYEHAR